MAVDDGLRHPFRRHLSGRDPRLYPDETRASVLHFLNATLACYARLGIHFRAVLTDNGTAYSSYAFADVWQARRTQAPAHTPYTPPTGNAERFVETAQLTV